MPEMEKKNNPPKKNLAFGRSFGHKYTKRKLRSDGPKKNCRKLQKIAENDKNCGKLQAVIPPCYSTVYKISNGNNGFRSEAE
jgi:hypothetical protein